MVYGGMGKEDKSTNWVNFQPVPASTSAKEIQIRRTQAKNCFPEWSVSAPDFFRDSRISVT